MSSIQIFPDLADAVHVWALSVADFFRGIGVNFPPAGSSM